MQADCGRDVFQRLALHGDAASNSVKFEFHVQGCRGRKLYLNLKCFLCDTDSQK